jgi:hypothetical protein
MYFFRQYVGQLRVIYTPTTVGHRGNKALAISRLYAAYAAVVWKPRMCSDQDFVSFGVVENTREDHLEETPT